jgi:hypothetical protein
LKTLTLSNVLDVEDAIKKWWEREIFFDEDAPLVIHLEADDSLSDDFSALSSDE